MLFNYIIGTSLNKEQKQVKHGFSKKTLLTFGIVSNIVLLGYFKYMDFFIENINLLSGATIPLMHLLLPLAISFFTFQQIAYLVDSYRQETAEYDFLNYALFVTFFPQLIAGPIVHHSEMMPQFDKTRNKLKNYRNIAMGLFIFAIGLFKKVVIADTFAIWATKGFDSELVLNFYEAWATSLSYTFQLYFDFSGYTDMAIGAALLFNIKLPINFDSPYKALSIQEFWRRWHITLSRFLKDYIYIPLGGNRKGTYRTYANLMATFIVGGIWHGAGWTFVFWGFLHGFALVIHRFWEHLGFKLWKWFAWFITFNFINIAWVFFRAQEWDDAIRVLRGMAGLTQRGMSEQFATLLSYINPLSDHTFHFINFHAFISIATLEMLLLGFYIVLFTKNSMEILATFKYKLYQAIFIVLTIWSVHFLSITGVQSQFLYFNF